MAASDYISPEAMKNLVQLTIRGDYDQVRQLATAQLVRARDQGGRTVIMLVASAHWTPPQTVKCIEHFLHLGADPMATDALGDTAAHLAARRDHLRLLAMLPFDLKWHKNRKCLTPLMDAARTGSWKCVKHLIHLLRQLRYNSGSNGKRLELLGMKNQQQNGQTALDMAKESGQMEIAFILEVEMRLVVKRNGDIIGLSASEEAKRRELKRLAATDYLMPLRRAATRVNCDLPGLRGQTALWFAAGRYCDEASLQQLLAAEVGDPTCADVGGASCLHRAAACGHPAAVREFTKCGAYVNDRFDHPIMGGELTPLMLATCYDPPNIAAETIQALLAAGADWRLKDRSGRTALDFAISNPCDPYNVDERHEIVNLLRNYADKDFFAASLKPSCCAHSLRCLAAESVARLRLSTAKLPKLLANFVEAHGFARDGCCL